jgi:hypothetical protein
VQKAVAISGRLGPTRSVFLQVERQRAAVEAADADAMEESRINRELAALMAARMDASRKAAEKLLGVLQVGPTESHFPRTRIT